jgi:hypothetical protein
LRVSAARRAKTNSRQSLSTAHGDARYSFAQTIAAWSPWIEKQVGPRTAKRNAKASKTMIELAWLWLRYQPDSALSI